MLSEFWSQKGWIALIPFILAALAFYAWIAIGADARAMARAGIVVDGTVIDTRRTTRPDVNSGARIYSYYATVSFPIGSATQNTLEIQQVEHFVSKSYWEETRIGDTVPVRYLPDHPDRIELEPGGTRSNSNAAGWVALGMGLLGAMIAGLMWANTAKIHRFKTQGTPVVVTISAVATQNTWSILSVTLPDGRPAKAIPIRPADPSHYVGATITVLTMPDSPDLVMLPP